MKKRQGIDLCFQAKQDESRGASGFPEKENVMKSRILTLLMTVVAVLMMRPESIWAANCSPTPTCGCTMVADLTLKANLGPCSGSDGIDIFVNNLTLSLGGHSITGVGDSTRAGVGIVGTGVTVKGPGTITAFGSGVFISAGGCALDTVQDLTLTSNEFGVALQSTTNNEIRHNTITAGFVGILFDNAASNKIKGNTISGQSNVGILINSAGGSVVTQNSVTGSGAGLGTDDSGGQLTVTFNNFSHNTGSGIGHIGGGSTITGNTANFNGFDGFTVGASNSNLMQDNITNSNAHQGISLTSGSGNQIRDNQALRNGADDLSWDGTGTNNCWALNDFKTENMALTPCAPVCVH